MFFFNLLKNFFSYYPFYALSITLLFLELLLLYKLAFKQNKTKDLKISCFPLNTFFILLYLSFFILLICFIRYVRWGLSFDLNLFYNQISELFNIYPKILSYICFFIVVIIILLIYLLKKFLNKEILKRYLYTYAVLHMQSEIVFKKKYPNKLITNKDYNWFIRICKKLNYFWSYDRLIDRLIFYIVITPYCTIFKTDSFGVLPIASLTFILKHLPLIVLIMLFLYDIYYNAYNIHLIFYYLPFYFVFQLWENVTSFLKNTNIMLNSILYELYYEKNVRYIDITTEEETFILTYIARNCRCLSNDIHDPDIYIKLEKQELISNFPIIFIRNRRYIRIDDTNVFENPHTGLQIFVDA